ncbi:MAG: methylaspartate mutase subunit E [Desulfitobacterium sp.]
METNPKITNKRWDDEQFYKTRKEVLGRWATGAEVDIEESAEYLKTLGENKFVVPKVLEAKEKGICLSQPRGGFPLLDDMINLHKTLENEGDEHVLLPVTTDSYTRSERFADVEKGLEFCRKGNKLGINGYPTVNHGVKNGRKLQEATNRPLYALGGNPLPCLNAEISIASGFTGYLGSGICVPVAYSKHVSIEQGIKNYQYVDRLVSVYQEKGISIYRETAGFLTWVLVPPSVEIALNTIDALLAAEQGVKYYGLGHSAQLNFLQDAVAVAALTEICTEYLERFNYKDVNLFTTLLSYGGPFPENEALAYGTIGAVAAAAGLAGVQGVSIKTIDEAIAVPTEKNNAMATLVTRQVLNIIGKNRYPQTEEFKFEKELLKKEARSILNRALELGEGDVAKGAVIGFDHGILDCPWSPNLSVKGKVLGARDHTGAVRYLDPGNVPIPKEVMEYHKEQLDQKMEKKKGISEYDSLVEDLMIIAKGQSLTF